MKIGCQREKQDGRKALIAVGEKLKAIVKENMSIGGNIDGGPIEILKEFSQTPLEKGQRTLKMRILIQMENLRLPQNHQNLLRRPLSLL